VRELRLCLVLLLGLLQACVSLRAAEIHGIATITDGDTVMINREKIRLIGMDAPETDQLCVDSQGKLWTCGIAARDALARRSEGKSWSCEIAGHDRYGRGLGLCIVDNEDIGRWMVKSGWALAYIRYSRIYEDDERQAKGARAGLWSGSFVAPWDWRRRDCTTEVLGVSAVSLEAHHLLCGSPSIPPTPACSIKGNLSSRGCIYHLPSDAHYGRLEMVGARKRWFCSEVEAEAAGCRRARN